MGSTTLQLLGREDQKLLATALLAGITCSSHSLTAGDRENSFLNLDAVLSDPGRTELIIRLLLSAVDLIRKEERIDRLGFIDISTRGPAALLSCRSALSTATGLPTIIVRPDKRLFASQISGDLNPEDRLLLLCDVLTTGTTMARAFAICARRQARVIRTIFAYDRDLAGREDLQVLGVRVEGLLDSETLLNLVPEALTDAQRESLTSLQQPKHHDLFALAASQL
jgi:orotate phosphoribosyltransferase